MASKSGRLPEKAGHGWAAGRAGNQRSRALPSGCSALPRAGSWPPARGVCRMPGATFRADCTMQFRFRDSLENRPSCYPMRMLRLSTGSARPQGRRAWPPQSWVQTRAVWPESLARAHAAVCPLAAGLPILCNKGTLSFARSCQGAWWPGLLDAFKSRLGLRQRPHPAPAPSPAAWFTRGLRRTSALANGGGGLAAGSRIPNATLSHLRIFQARPGLVFRFCGRWCWTRDGDQKRVLDRGARL